MTIRQCRKKHECKYLVCHLFIPFAAEQLIVATCILSAVAETIFGNHANAETPRGRLGFM